MKTWEMIKALTENPKLKFTVEEFTASVDSTGLLNLEYNGDKANADCNIRINDVGSIKADDWELIHEPVDFMTAMNSGRGVKPVSHTGESDFYSPIVWLTRRYLSLDIINGKWLIE